MYCRKCGYVLNGLPEPRCPECGQAFDPARRRTYRTRTRRERWWRVVKWTTVCCAALALTVGAAVGYLYYGYCCEQRAIGQLGHLVQTDIVGPDWLGRWAGERGWPILDRVTHMTQYVSSKRDLSPLKELRWLRDLQVLSLDGGDPARPRGPVLDERMFRPVSQLAGLEGLCIEETVVLDDVFGTLGGLKRLKGLYVENAEISDAAMASLADLTALEHVELYHTHLRGPGLSYLKQLDQLRILGIGDARLQERDIAQLAGLTHLEVVCLPGCELYDEDVRPIGKLAGLQVLDLSRTKVGDAGMASLSELTRLHTLTLAGTRITSQSLRVIGGYHRLSSLDLSDTQIDDTGIEQLTRLAALRRLNLSGTRVTVEGVAVLGSLPQLRFLDISGVKVTDDNVRKLSVFGRLSELKVVKVDSSQLSEEGMQVLGQNRWYQHVPRPAATRTAGQ
jgi:Leucine-rich repeat (LRR) protein